MHCWKCGEVVDDEAVICIHCGCDLKKGYSSAQRDLDRNDDKYLNYNNINNVSPKSYLLGGILNILFPGIGRIYLGYGKKGVIQLLLTFVGVGAIWGLIDGIIILCGNLKKDGQGRKFNI
ncbi:MAG: TM2 domain-containing protein [Bacilli bacterium]|nr:TM2 domain-containing protein [Bacilli bacterium]